jgi:hypothetical protein
MISQTHPPEAADTVISEPGPDSYVIIDTQRHPIVAWRWDGERGMPLVAFEDGVWEADMMVVTGMCVRGQSVSHEDPDYYGDEEANEEVGT